MEFIEGETLANHLTGARPLSPEAALPIIRQIATALDTLHERGILHRDLKPSNVMLDQRVGSSGRAVLMDFGLAKGSDNEHDVFESSLHFQGGAPYFMAPEQLRGDRPTRASDIYAFGLLIDEMVTASRAFPADSMQSLYYAKLWEKPVSPALRSAGVPEHWAEAIIRCLDHDPAQRCTSARDLICALESPERKPRRRPLTLFLRYWSAHPRLRKFAVSLSLVLSALMLGALAAPPARIAVFDIVNDTGDNSYNYFCGGLTKELVRRFDDQSEISAVPMHETQAGPRKSRERLTLNGQLRHTNGEVVLTVNLVDSNKGNVPVWWRDFSQTQIGDPLRVETEVLKGTIEGLQRTVSIPTLAMRARHWLNFPSLNKPFRAGIGSTAGPSRAGSSGNGRALDDYMRGRQMSEQMSPDNVRTGIELLQRSVAEDPSFALGYTALANANFTMMNWNYTPQPKLLAGAKAFAQTAITLDPNLAEAYEARGLVFQHEWDWSHAREDYLRALRLKPTFALARRHYAALLAQIGEVDEGVRQVRQALQDDPYDESALPGYGLLLYIAGRPKEAIQLLEPAAARGMAAACHNLAEAYAVLAGTSADSTKVDYLRKSLEQAERVRQIESRSTLGTGGPKANSDLMFAQYYSLMSNPAAAEPYLERLPREIESNLVSPAEAAWVYASAGRQNEALGLLEKAAAAHDRHLLFIKVYPFAKNLRGEPRFQQILSQMHL